MGANAQTKVPTFAAAEVLTAANQNLLSNGIPVFSGTATRNDAFGGSGEKTLAEGQFAYLEDSNITQFYDGASWLALGKLGQVSSVTKTDAFTTTSLSYTDLTGLTLTITPSATTSKILVVYSVMGSGVTATNMGGIQILRGATAIGNADAAGSRSVANTVIPELALAQTSVMSNAFLDSPSTTSATTYKLQVRTFAAGTIYINRLGENTDNAVYGRGTSTLTLFEVLA
jgi:hypothetical protein